MAIALMDAMSALSRGFFTRRRAFIAAATFTAAGAFACGAVHTDPMRSAMLKATAGTAQVAASLTGQTAPIANSYEKETFVGFDTHTYPGTSTMHAWKNTPGSPYKWVGYYLPSPCHANTSWVGKRDTLIAMGWGLAVVFVGQQTWGKTPRNLSPTELAALAQRTPCSADLVTASQGARDADKATAAARAEGFPAKAIVFLDIERMETIPPAMRDYYRAWAARMLANKLYRPGIYAHEHNAAAIFDDMRDTFAAAGDTTTPRFWVAGGKGFDTGRAPQDVGFAFAGVWQGVIDVARSVANVKLPVDLNVASWSSPSESGIVTQ